MSKRPALERLPQRVVKSAVKDGLRVRERRELLIVSAIEVFKAKGFHAATVRDIGRVAKMTQGTIYNYVSSKDDILFLVCDRLVEQYQDETSKALASVSEPVERVHSAIKSVCEVMYAHQDEILLIYQNSHLLDEKSRKVVLARVKGFVKQLEMLITDAAKEANVPVDDTYLAANIFTFLPTMIALRRWAFSGERSRDEIVSSISDFLVKGLGFHQSGQTQPLGVLAKSGP